MMVITVDPDQMCDVPCIRGLGMPVTTVAGVVADGMSKEEIFEICPELESQDIREAIPSEERSL